MISFVSQVAIDISAEPKIFLSTERKYLSGIVDFRINLFFFCLLMYMSSKCILRSVSFDLHDPLVFDFKCTENISKLNYECCWIFVCEMSDFHP